MQSNGITYQALRALIPNASTLGRIGNGTLQHHLRKLERLRLVTSARAGLARYYFDAERHCGRVAANHAALAQPALKHAARLIVQFPGATQGNLAAKMGGTPATARQRFKHHVTRLIRLGLVTETRNGRTKTYAASSELDQLLR